MHIYLRLSAMCILLLCAFTLHTEAFMKHQEKDKKFEYDKILFTKIKTLTLYRGRLTTARRLDPVPQLTCEGSLCRRFQPSVVQCQNQGDDQWKCEAQLPAWAQFGSVQVSCEGWDFADDIHVLKGSCALRYELLPSSNRMSGKWESILFGVLFWGIAIFIILSLLHACLGKETGPNTRGQESDSGKAPPPYQKQETITFSSPITRALTAVGLGSLASYLFRTRSTNPSTMYGEAYRPFPAYGTMPHHGVYYGDAASQIQSERIAQSSQLTHSSAGYGGTQNR